MLWWNRGRVATKVLGLGAAILLVILLLPTLLVSNKPTTLNYLTKIFGIVGKQWVLHGVDHKEAAARLRVFARQSRWDLPPTGRPVTFIPSDSAAFPKQVKKLKASSVRVYDDRVELEFGGTPLHFGIVVFREGDGNGLKRLSDGVWFYSEDGKASIF